MIYHQLLPCSVVQQSRLGVMIVLNQLRQMLPSSQV